MEDSKQEEPMCSQREGSTPLERLQSFFSFMTVRVNPGEQVPDPPLELVDWAQNTMLGTVAGLLYCGGRQWLANRREGPYMPPNYGLSRGQIARLIAEDRTRRIAQLGNEALRGAFRFGSLTSVFFAVQHLGAIARDQHDLQNTVVAAAVTGGIFGFNAVPGNLRNRGRSGLLGSLLGALVGIPTGYVQGRLLELLPQEEQERRGLIGFSSKPSQHRQREPILSYADAEDDKARAVIAHLEASLHRSPKHDPGPK